jgi:hypothetical protein
MNNPTQTPQISDDNYWQQNHISLPNHETEAYPEVLQPAYQAGHEGYDRYSGKSFDEAETELQSDYAQLAQKGGISVPWQNAKDAAREAWDQAGTT